MKFVINIYGSRKGGNESETDRLCDRLKKSLRDSCPDDDLFFNFIDTDSTENRTDHDDNLMEQIDDGALGCPLITINDEIVADGIMSPETVVKWFEQHR